MDKQIKNLKELSEIAGVSGFETRVKELLLKRLESACESVEYDKLGSIIFKTKNNNAELKILLAAHMDEVGFMVKTITEQGFLRFTCLGGWWEQVMLGQRVIVHADQGDLIGIIGSTPPHILTPEERTKVVNKKDMYIDIGVDSAEAAAKLGVHPGVFITPAVQFEQLADNNYLLGKAWDDRVGCAVIADIVEHCADTAHPNTVFAAGTVQEEVGLRGAVTCANKVNPDLAIIIDTGVAGGVPGVAKEQACAELGKGVAITIYDASMIPNTQLRDLVLATAQELNIPHQISFSEGGGTDAGKIHMQNIGVPSLVLTVPVRYLHSHQSVFHLQDYISCVELVKALLTKLDPKIYDKIIKG